MPQIDFAARQSWFDTYLDGLEAEGARTIVAEWDGDMSGFMTIDPRRATIEQIAVHPARQGRGVASALMAAARLLSPAGLELTVNRDNAPARRFYARHSFEDAGHGTNPNSGLPVVVLRWSPGAPKSAVPQAHVVAAESEP